VFSPQTQDTDRDIGCRTRERVSVAFKTSSTMWGVRGCLRLESYLRSELKINNPRPDSQMGWLGL